MDQAWVDFFSKVEQNKARRLAEAAEREASTREFENYWYHLRNGAHVTNCLISLDHKTIKHGHTGPCNCC